MDYKNSLLDKRVIEVLNYRIQQEELSSRIYEQMSLWLNDKGYVNFSKLYKIYADEELKHAGWSKSYLLDYGITPTLMPLPSPKMEYTDLLGVLEATLQHELDITKQCEDMASVALKGNMHVLYALSSKYCAEQQEEIGKAITNLDIYKLSKDMLVIDNYIGENILE